MAASDDRPPWSGLRGKLAELSALRVEVAAFQAPTVDVVVVLDDDWGRKGRGARIRAAILAEGLTAADVAERFQLALSTSKKYVRESLKAQTVKPARSKLAA